MLRRGFLLLLAILVTGFLTLVFIDNSSEVKKGLSNGLSDLDKFASGSELEGAFSFERYSALLAYAYESGAGGLFIKDSRTGITSQIPSAGRWSKSPIISKGGRYVAYFDFVPNILGDSRTLFVFDRETGLNHLIHHHQESDNLGNALFSPDGTQLIYELIHMKLSFDKDEFRAVDLNTFEDRRLYAGGWNGARAPTFSPDGKRLYFYSGGCVVRIIVETGAKTTLACLPDQALLYPKDIGEAPIVSPDESRLFFTLQFKGCPRIASLTVADAEIVFLDQNECGLRPRLLGDSHDRLVYIALPLDGNRLIKIRHIKDGSTRLLGSHEAMTYQVIPEGEELYALWATPYATRRIWRIGIESGIQTALVTGDGLVVENQLVRSMKQITVRSFDGMEIPVRIFYPACRKSEVGPTVLYIHGSPLGREDVSPRLSREIGYLLAKGFTVIAPNYRGSTGYGDRIGSDTNPDSQVEDLVAVTRGILERPDVDPKQIYAMGICFSAETLLYRVTAAFPDIFKGLIFWSGGVAGVSALEGQKSNVLWIITSKDTTMQQLQLLDESARQRLLSSVEILSIDDTHLVTDGQSRMTALTALGNFIEQRSGISCANLVH